MASPSMSLRCERLLPWIGMMGPRALVRVPRLKKERCQPLSWPEMSVDAAFALPRNSVTRLDAIERFRKVEGFG